MRGSIAIGLWVVFLLLHLAVTTLYIFRSSLPQVFSNLSIRYCSPLFHQNWMLFAPDVSDYNVELEFLKHHDAGLKSWVNLSEEFGFEETSVMKRIENSIATGMAWDYTERVFSKDGILHYENFMESRSYHRAGYLIHRYSNALGIICPDTIQMRLIFHFTQPPGSAEVFLTDSIILPPYILERN